MPGGSGMISSSLNRKTKKSKNFINKIFVNAGIDPSRILFKFSDEVENGSV
jgi:hypothetical protein